MRQKTFRQLLHTCLLTTLAACSGEQPVDEQARSLAIDRAAAHFDAQAWGQARQALAAVVAGKQARAEDLLRAAAVEYADNQIAAARALLERARKLDPQSPGVLYLFGQLARDDGEFATAKPFFEAAHRLLPEDLPTRLALAECLRELGDSAGAEAQYRSVIEIGVENATQWYVAAVYRMMRMCTEEGRDQEAARYAVIWRDLEKLGAKAPDASVMARGNLARVRPAAPTAGAAPAEPLPPGFAKQARSILPEFASATRLATAQLNDDGLLDLWAVTPRGLVVAMQDEQGGYAVQFLTDAPPTIVECFDLDKDDDLDFAIAEGETLAYWLQTEGRFERKPIQSPSFTPPLRALLAVDYDHEGDLDLVLCDGKGVALWRNDGAGMQPSAADPKKVPQFSAATQGSGLEQPHVYDWVLAEDLDSDNDVDLLFGGTQAVLLADSLRAGRFADKTGRIAEAATALVRRPLVADFDADGRADILGAAGVQLQNRAGSFAKPSGQGLPAQAEWRAADLDFDGTIDWLASVPGAAAPVTRLAVGSPRERAATVADVELGGGAWALGDERNTAAWDLFVADAQGLRVHAGIRGKYRAKPVSLKGLRDNARALGAVVEYRAGPIYRRIYWRGGPDLLGVGERNSIDILRIAWPNGALSHQMDLDLTGERNVDDPEAAFSSILQPPAQIGSCPFLYTWNGQRYEFVTDVLGITPLGLPIAPGMLVPPDHDEYVLIKAEQLAPKDGFYSLQFTEELREVTYLDHARLIAVDHPEDTEIYPNERFTFPPFPLPHTHTVKAPLAPERALGSDGKDWTRELSAIDDEHAVPFELHPLQFAGLCKPWFVELCFDKDRVRDARRLRLLMTGWFFWSDASANMASARAPGVDFIPPMIEVPDGQGGWRPSGPPVGFPAGKTKTMVIDVTGILDREDPRLRVSGTLRLYWDALRLAIDADDAPLTTHELPVHSSKLWLRGFSAPLEGLSGLGAVDSDKPERFDWDRLASQPRWNHHPGMYTRYGEVTPLLHNVDDMFAILGSGDALELRFDARALPAPAAGLRRDFLVYLDGWAKDRDPNTIEALEVEPLPFHGMSGYPYRGDEHYPDSEAHQRYRREWNTRPALQWIRPLAPGEEGRWLAGN
jgi:tetratricopeptide (TPR) repeat protein